MRAFAIIPAAGGSRRMGRSKLRLAWPGPTVSDGPSEGETILESLLRAWSRSRVERIVVVGRADDGWMRGTARRMGAAFVAPDAPPPEMKDSILAGVRFLESAERPEERDAWLVAPADMPRLPSSVIDRLIAAYAARGASVVQPSIEGRRGHPVLLAWRLAADLDQLPPGEGLSSLIRRHAVHELPCDDPAILDDVDTPEDYERIQRHCRGSLREPPEARSM